MNKTEFIKEVQKEYSERESEKAITIKQLETLYDAATAVIADELKKGEKIAFAGFGKFETRERAAREGRNPQTGETIKIAASKAIHFTPGSVLKGIVNE